MPRLAGGPAPLPSARWSSLRLIDACTQPTRSALLCPTSSAYATTFSFDANSEHLLIVHADPVFRAAYGTGVLLSLKLGPQLGRWRRLPAAVEKLEEPDLLTTQNVGAPLHLVMTSKEVSYLVDAATATLVQLPQILPRWAQAEASFRADKRYSVLAADGHLTCFVHPPEQPTQRLAHFPRFDDVAAWFGNVSARSLPQSVAYAVGVAGEDHLTWYAQATHRLHAEGLQVLGRSEKVKVEMAGHHCFNRMIPQVPSAPFDFFQVRPDVAAGKADPVLVGWRHVDGQWSPQPFGATAPGRARVAISACGQTIAWVGKPGGLQVNATCGSQRPEVVNVPPWFGVAESHFFSPIDGSLFALYNRPNGDVDKFAAMGQSRQDPLLAQKLNAENAAKHAVEAQNIQGDEAILANFSRHAEGWSLRHATLVPNTWYDRSSLDGR